MSIIYLLFSQMSDEENVHSDDESCMRSIHREIYSQLVMNSSSTSLYNDTFLVPIRKQQLSAVYYTAHKHHWIVVQGRTVIHITTRINCFFLRTYAWIGLHHQTNLGMNLRIYSSCRWRGIQGYLCTVRPLSETIKYFVISLNEIINEMRTNNNNESSH